MSEPCISPDTMRLVALEYSTMEPPFAPQKTPNTDLMISVLLALPHRNYFGKDWGVKHGP